MSFSVRDDKADVEYNGHNLNTLFAQRSNLVRPGFYRMVSDILRFNRLARESSPPAGVTLAEYLDQHQFGHAFRSRYLYPMAAAIWSSGQDDVREFPAHSLVNFFVNHGLADIRNRPQWYVVEGGSREYVRKMAGKLGQVFLRSPVVQIKRGADSVELSVNGQKLLFDEVVIATHSDQALTMLEDPTGAEVDTLGNIGYTPNHAILHTDRSQLPARPRAWASWNYRIPQARSTGATLTYNMNILQGIKTPSPLLVTLNDPGTIDPALVIAEYDYQHPRFDLPAIAAQQRHNDISGVRHTHYCGAYWYNGFHEDGVLSALRVCRQLGVKC
jgi:predicted NAD/FAD-binding protein